MKEVIFPLPKPNILLLVRAGIAVAISEEVDAGGQGQPGLQET